MQIFSFQEVRKRKEIQNFHIMENFSFRNGRNQCKKFEQEHFAYKPVYYEDSLE